MRLGYLTRFISSIKMPKKVSSASKSKDSKVEPAAASPVTMTKDGRFSLSIQVKPGAKTSSITGVFDDYISLQINAPPVDGEANVEILKFLADILKVKKNDLELKGSKSRQKTIIIQSEKLSIPEIISTLSKEVQK